MSGWILDVGWWARRQLAFTIPVIIKPNGKTQSFPALFWPYVFNDSPIAVTTGREFTGLPTQYGRLSDGVDPWLQADRKAGRKLMIATLEARRARVRGCSWWWCSSLWLG